MIASCSNKRLKLQLGKVSGTAEAVNKSTQLRNSLPNNTTNKYNLFWHLCKLTLSYPIYQPSDPQKSPRRQSWAKFLSWEYRRSLERQRIYSWVHGNNPGMCSGMYNWMAVSYATCGVWEKSSSLICKRGLANLPSERLRMHETQYKSHKKNQNVINRI